MKIVCWTSCRVAGGAAWVTGRAGSDDRERSAGVVFGDSRISPARSAGSYSRRSRLIRWAGSDSRNAAATSGSLGAAVNPAGSISRTSGGANLAKVLLDFRYSDGVPALFQIPPGASGPNQPGLARAASTPRQA